MKPNIATNKTNAKKTHFLLIPLMLCTVYAGLGANMQGIFALLPIISEEFDLSRAGAGLYSSFYFLSATTVAVFSGRLIDKIGSRKGLICGTGGISVVMLTTAFAPSYGIILALAFLCGLVFSCITPSVSRGIIEHSDPKRRAFSMGIAHSGGGSGGMLAAVILPVIASRHSWRVAIFCSASFALAIAALIAARYPSDQRKSGDGSDPEPDTGFRDEVRNLAKSRSFLLICGLGILLGCVMSSVGAHFALFLTSDFNLSPVRAGIGLAILQAGGVTGMSGWGLLSDKLFGGNRSKTLTLLVVAIGGVSLSIAVLGHAVASSYALILVSAFFTGFICLGTMALFFTTITEAAGEGRAGMATGMALIFSRTGVIIGPPAFGRIADITGTYSFSWLALGGTAVLFVFFFRALSARLEQ